MICLAYHSNIHACIILYHIILYYIILYYNIPYHIMLHHLRVYMWNKYVLFDVCRKTRWYIYIWCKTCPVFAIYYQNMLLVMLVFHLKHTSPNNEHAIHALPTPTSKYSCIWVITSHILQGCPKSHSDLPNLCKWKSVVVLIKKQ